MTCDNRTCKTFLVVTTFFFLLTTLPLKASSLSVGFGRANITPRFDPFIDTNGNGRYDKDDRFIDQNQNGVFDPIWLAGFHKNRPASGVHDDLWVQSMVLDDGKQKIAVVVLDLLGIMHDQVLQIRKHVSKLGLDQVLVHATHTHAAPDLIGLWGPDDQTRGVSEAYQKWLFEQIHQSLQMALSQRQATKISFLEISEIPDGLQVDSRPPMVIDSALRLLVFQKAGATKSSSDIQGILLNWANHPEVLGKHNHEITADYVGSFRSFVEKRISKANEMSPLAQQDPSHSFGMTQGNNHATAIFINGAIGGLITPIGAKTRHPITQKLMPPLSFEQAEAVGLQLAMLVLKNLPEAKPLEADTMHLHSQSLQIPIGNPKVSQALETGLLRRAWPEKRFLKTEAHVLRIGELSILMVPGELFPEMAMGGIVATRGAPYEHEKPAVPPLYQLASPKMLWGLSNDLLGYLIPKSQWDPRPRSPYGEESAVGPESGPMITKALWQLLEQSQEQK